MINRRELLRSALIPFSATLVLGTRPEAGRLEVTYYYLPG